MNKPHLLLAFAILAGLASLVFGQEPLRVVNPLGYQKVSVPDYPRYAPNPEPLTGDFIPAFSGTSELFLKGIFDQLTRIHPGASWGEKFHYHSSAGVIWLMLNGRAQVGISSIPMSSAQREEFTRRFGHPVLEARIALDALQILVHPSNPVEYLTVPQLDAIYGTELRAGALNRIRTWAEAGVAASGMDQPIHPYAGLLHYGTSKFFQEVVLEDGPWNEEVRTLGHVQHPEAAIDKDPLGIAFSNYRPRDERVKVLPIARQTEEPPNFPLPRHIYGEEYPLVRLFYVYANAEAVEDLPPEAREFLEFLLSYEGQSEIAKTGSLPLDRTMLLRARKRLGL